MERLVRYLGLVLGILCTAAGLILFAILVDAGMFPGGYLLLYLLVVGCLDGLVLFLTRSFQKKIQFVLGAAISIGFTIACVLIGLYLARTVQMIRAVSDTEGTDATISFFVADSSPAQTIEDVSDLTFGILPENDRQSVEDALEQVEQEYGFRPNVREYPNIISLADGFHKKEIDGVLMNEGYMGLYEDLAGYEDFRSELKVLGSLKVQSGACTEEQKTEAESEPEETGEEQDDIINVLISGSDTRGAAVDQRGRSDVNIIVSANLKTHEALLISTPRDYFVALDLPISNAYDKLTHAGVYGMDVLMGTLSKLYGIKIDYFFRLNFTGFVDIIDAMGGIEVVSDYEFDSNGYHFEKGKNQLDGEAALVFVRDRFAFAAGDRQRGANQIAVLKGAAQKAMSLTVLTNYMSILESVENCIYTNVPYEVLSGLVRQQLEDMQEWKLSSFSVNGSDAKHTTYSINQSLYVMIPDQSTIEQAQQMLKDLGNDVSPSAGACQ